MRRRLFVLLGYLVLTLASPPSPAWAGIYKFDGFSVNVPSGWLVTRENKVVALASPGRECWFFITTGLSERPHSNVVAPVMAEFVDKYKVDLRRKVTLTRLRERRVVVTIVGDHSDRTTVYYSIKELPPAFENPFKKPKR